MVFTERLPPWDENSSSERDIFLPTAVVFAGLIPAAAALDVAREIVTPFASIYIGYEV